VYPFHLDMINLNMIKKRNINKLEKSIVMMKSINKRLMKAKLKHYKNTKKESKNMILI